MSVTIKRARKAMEKMYTDIATVYEYQNVKDEDTKITSQRPVATIEDIPCRVSFSSIQTTGETSGAAEIGVSIKLFLAPDVQIKPGSKIAVKQDEVIKYYESSGEPAVYGTHQEIMLKNAERWA